MFLFWMSEEKMKLIDFFEIADLVKFIEKVFDKFNNLPSIQYTRDNWRYFRKFKQVIRSEHGRGANDFNNVLEYEGENCYIWSGNWCFLKFVN